MALTVSLVTTNEGLNCDMLQLKGVNDGSAAASAIYIGFVPRKIDVFNITDGIRSEYTPNNTAGTSWNTAANGTVTVAAANGFTMLPAATVTTTVTATGSPASAGAAGFQLSTGILIASKTYDIYCWR